MSKRSIHGTFCDTCLLGDLIPGQMLLRCKKNHPVQFVTPQGPAFGSTVSAWAKAKESWGWQPVARYCRDFITRFSITQPEKKRRRSHHDPAYRPTHEPARPQLEPPHGSITTPLPVRDLPGLDVLNENYAAELEAGRAAGNRLFGKDSE